MYFQLRFENQTVTLCCNATDNSNKSPQIKWYKDRKLIPPGELYSADDPSLRIRRLKIEDAGTYQCHANNRAGLDLSPQVTIKVKSEAEESCPDQPAPHWLDIPEGCPNVDGSNRVNIGKCVGFDEAVNSQCLHRDQFRESVQKQCKDAQSNFCCGPVEKEELKISCSAPGSPNTKYDYPVTKIRKCSCTKC